MFENITDKLNFNLQEAWKEEYVRLGDVYATWGAIMVVFLYPLAMLPEVNIVKDNITLWYFFRLMPSVVVGITYVLYKRYKFSHEILFEILAFCIFASGAYRAACGEWIPYVVNNITLFITGAFLTILRPYFFIINYFVILLMNSVFNMIFCGASFGDYWLEKGTPLLIVGGMACFSIAIFRYFILKNNYQQRTALKHAHDELQDKNDQIVLQNEELQTQKEEILSQRDMMEDQKNDIEDKNNNIISSITYAKHIQDALLQQTQALKQVFHDFMVFFRPRDIVSGDFYWMREINGKTYIAVVDCTGHGVPGAFMSMLANSSLNNVLLAHADQSPEKLLELLDDEVCNILRGDVTGAFDGMDISLCVIDPQEKKLTFAGAHHPLLFFKNGEKIFIKGGPQGIGGHHSVQKRFEKHEISLDEPLVFYLYTDGFQDQFGGPKDKKYMRGRFQKFLEGIHNRPMKEQQKLLHEEIERWMNYSDQSQVDDILIMGFKIG